MSFWFGMVVISAAVAVVLLAGLWRSGAAPATGPGRKEDLRVYRDQLAEVERDLARGVVAPGDAERLRTEIARRILDADRDRTSGPAPAAAPAGARWTAVAVIAALPLGAWAIHDRIGAPGYDDLPLSVRLEAAAERLANRPDQAVMEARHTAWLAEAGIVPDTPRGEEGAAIERLRSLLADARRDDVEGHRLLAMVEARLGDFPAAARAMSRAIDLQGDAAGVEDFVALAELKINAAGGYVSPQAEAALEAALWQEPGHGLALYLYGEMFLQNDRPDLAFQLWRRSLELSEPDEIWVDEIRDRIETVALLAGERFTLPPRGFAARGPSAEQIADAMDLPEEDRAAMIGGMVDALAARLANDGGNAQDWARLIASYGVLGRRDDAAATWTEAQTVFAGHPEALATIRAAAEAAGVAQ